MESMLLWAIAVIVPFLAIVGYWFIARRQVRKANRDLTSRLEAERLLRRKVSHQVRNPLTVIYGFSEALLDTELEDPEEVRTVISTINAEALAVSRTVENLVAASKVANDELRARSIVFEPSGEIGRAVLPFERLGATIAIDGPELTALGDPVIFRQIVQNLVANAVRHGGSEISVIATVNDDAYACIIADDGDGLPASVAERLFPRPPEPVEPEATDTGGDESEQTVTTPEQPSVEPEVASESDADDGLGLGLPVSIALAEKLGGSLEYERSLGATMFTLSLPTSSVVEVQRQDTPAETSAVDDEQVESEEDEAPPPEPEPVFDDATISFGPDTAGELEPEPSDDVADTSDEEPNAAAVEAPTAS